MSDFDNTLDAFEIAQYAVELALEQTDDVIEDLSYVYVNDKLGLQAWALSEQKARKAFYNALDARREAQLAAGISDADATKLYEQRLGSPAAFTTDRRVRFYREGIQGIDVSHLR